jgi:hypothetical protein
MQIDMEKKSKEPNLKIHVLLSYLKHFFVLWMQIPLHCKDLQVTVAMSCPSVEVTTMVKIHQNEVV